MDISDLPWLSAGRGMSNAGLDGNSYEQMTRDLQTILEHQEGGGRGRLTAQQIRELTTTLPKLSEEQLESLGHHESSCPICMNTFLASIAEEELALVMDSPAHPVEDLGVTRLVTTCGHLFCRKDILTWIRDGHPSCPLCRTAFFKSRDVDPPPRTATTAPTTDLNTPPTQTNTDPDDHDEDDAYDQAMERILAAYREERQRIRAAPAFDFPGGGSLTLEQLQAHLSSEGGGLGAGGPFMFGAVGAGAGREREEEDRREYAGMYS